MRHFFGTIHVTPRPNILLTLLLFTAALNACASPLSTPAPVTVPSSQFPPTHWMPPLAASWQIQFSGTLDTTLPVNIYELDLFDTPPETIASLQARGVKVICYFSAGTYENWRPDANQFPASLLGSDLPDWPGEKWLDIRDLQTLAPIMLRRITLAAQKGCDGVDPDNVDGYTNTTGFLLTPEDQLAYNIFLANSAHQNGLGIGLKNDLEQIPALVEFFDWAINEQCFSYQECPLLLPFTEAGKPVFVIEYQPPPETFCQSSIDLNFNAIQKNPNLDAFRFPCR